MALTGKYPSCCERVEEKDYPVFEKEDRSKLLDVSWRESAEEERDGYLPQFDQVHASCGFRSMVKSLLSSARGAFSKRPKKENVAKQYSFKSPQQPL